MKEIKFNICDEVWYFNTASRKIEKVVIKGIQVVPTGISVGEDGKERLDGDVVLYQTKDGPVLAETEVFASADEAREVLLGVLSDMAAGQ